MKNKTDILVQVSGHADQIRFGVYLSYVIDLSYKCFSHDMVLNNLITTEWSIFV